MTVAAILHLRKMNKVCNEETIKEIEDHYLAHNAHADSYLWKRLGKKDEGEPAMVVARYVWIPFHIHKWNLEIKGGA